MCVCRFETTTLLKNRWWGHLRFSISCDCLACNSSVKYGGPRICGSFPTRRHQRHINRTFSWITQHVWCCWGWVWCVFFRFDVLSVSHQSRKKTRAFHAPKTAKIPLLQGCLFSWASAFPSLGLEDSEKYGAPFSTWVFLHWDQWFRDSWEYLWCSIRRL